MPVFVIKAIENRDVTLDDILNAYLHTDGQQGVYVINWLASGAAGDNFV